MNAYELYDAAFDSACDNAEATSEYVSEYAAGAFNLAISDEIAELIASKKREWDALTEEGKANSNEFWHRVHKPLEAITL